ncbi:NDR1/HIN1-like protein 6 [Chenopodium quinoa]|uniref:Late embryogenesis abundant protein LEA-2 subgroup domain-containing protein n=1 Tax=Chenopodium quinoa TaxID=63459 RepID=A0A803ND60_CHEQI|nr:NDR1/HIN1-like protein 6 [Chenopodium quinoa]
MSTDHQRIHPAPDVEAPPPSSAPLIPPNTLKSDSTGREHYPPLPHRAGPPPAYPISPPPYKCRKRSCCCRAFCCIFCTLLVLIVAIGATIGILFLIFRPKIPDYSIDTLKVTQFSPNNNNSISATFVVNITAHNPNKRIGIYYLGGSSLTAWYKDIQLCQGSLPKFYQGHRNTTNLDVSLSGTINDASGLSSTLQQQQQDTGNIPLVLRAKVPVKIKLGKLKLMKMRFRVTCHLSIDKLANRAEIRIGSSSCKFRLKRIF